MKTCTPSREGLKMIAIPVRPDLHRRLKIRAAETDHTLEEICRAAFEKYLSEANQAARPVAA